MIKGVLISRIANKTISPQIRFYSSEVDIKYMLIQIKYLYIHKIQP